MSKRICVDLDGVICELKKEGQSYEELKPVDGAPEKLSELRKNGFYIIIHTARRMKTCNANLGMVIKDIGGVTLNWLERHKIEYDEIFFGKPWADIYIDDNGYRFSDWSKIDSDGKNLPKNKEQIEQNIANSFGEK